MESVYHNYVTLIHILDCKNVLIISMKLLCMRGSIVSRCPQYLRNLVFLKKSFLRAQRKEPMALRQFSSDCRKQRIGLSEPDYGTEKGSWRGRGEGGGTRQESCSWWSLTINLSMNCKSNILSGPPIWKRFGTRLTERWKGRSFKDPCPGLN